MPEFAEEQLHLGMDFRQEVIPLNHYAANVSLMILDQHTLIFLPGYHMLDTNLVIDNRSGMTLKAGTISSHYDEVVITCVEEVGMTFINVQELTRCSLLS